MNIHLLSYYYDLLLCLDVKNLIFRHKLTILTPMKTLQVISRDKLSVSRFGDGEFSVMHHADSSRFQDRNPALTKKMEEVLTVPISKHLVCIPYFMRNRSPYRFHTRFFVQGFLLKHFNKDVRPFLRTDYQYGDSQFTRFYMMMEDKSKTAEIVEKIKSLWDKRDILIVEGENGRLGVGNDLLDNTKSIKRIIAPSKNAFSLYEEILDAAREHGKNRLILISLGMTATCLAYDLAKEGFWAIDIGQVDIEYMWWKMGATEKVPIPGRYVNEVNMQMYTDPSDPNDYQKQVVARLCKKREKSQTHCL